MIVDNSKDSCKLSDSRFITEDLIAWISKLCKDNCANNLFFWQFLRYITYGIREKGYNIGPEQGHISCLAHI